ncbi:MAG: hypothetical protein V4627_04280 [Pseudomonadota bacterium]
MKPTAKTRPSGQHIPVRFAAHLLLLLSACLVYQRPAVAAEPDWSIGGYGGKFYDTEPAGLTQGKATFMNHHMLAVTGTKTIWRSQSLPMSIEIDGMIGQQFGMDSLTEIAIAPVLRWSSFPWKDTLQTDLRLGPLGLSYTSKVSALELGPEGKGSQTLNFLMIELAFSRPQDKSREVFVRLHHRCAVYDLLNNYGANGEDFLSFGYRVRF